MRLLGSQGSAAAGYLVFSPRGNTIMDYGGDEEIVAAGDALKAATQRAKQRAKQAARAEKLTVDVSECASGLLSLTQCIADKASRRRTEPESAGDAAAPKAREATLPVEDPASALEGLLDRLTFAMNAFGGLGESGPAGVLGRGRAPQHPAAHMQTQTQTQTQQSDFLIPSWSAVESRPATSHAGWLGAEGETGELIPMPPAPAPAAGAPGASALRQSVAHRSSSSMFPSIAAAAPAPAAAVGSSASMPVLAARSSVLRQTAADEAARRGGALARSVSAHAIESVVELQMAMRNDPSSSNVRVPLGAHGMGRLMNYCMIEDDDEQSENDDDDSLPPSSARRDAPGRMGFGSSASSGGASKLRLPARPTSKGSSTTNKVKFAGGNAGAGQRNAPRRR
jgi:hypothetical protein